MNKLGFFSLVCAQLAAAVLGAVLAGQRNLWAAACAGAVLGTWVWLAWQTWQAQRLLHWLHKQNLQTAPPAGLRGVYKQVLHHSRTWLRAQSRVQADAQAQIQDLLAAFNASPNGVLLLEGQLIQWCNRTAQAHFGLELPRDAAQRIGHIVREPSFTRWWQDTATKSQGECAPALRLHLRTGQVVSVQAHAYGPDRWLLLSHDITHMEQAQAQRRDFVANVSHELRTPLTVLVGFVETLQTLPLGDNERSRYLGLMQQQCSRMQHLVEDLLTLSRLEGSPAPGLDARVAVADWLAQCIAAAQALSAHLGAHHSFSVPAPDAPDLQLAVAGEASELTSALGNLLDNAVRYTPAGGHIRVSWQRLPDGSARLSVHDSGLGIPSEHLPRLAERFYRIDPSRSRNSGGTGLGLAIVKHALQRHDAQLIIESPSTGGARFSAIFPSTRLFPLSRNAA